MNDVTQTATIMQGLLGEILQMRRSISSIQKDASLIAKSPHIAKFVAEAGKLQTELQAVRELVSPVRFGSIGITLGRSDSIAKFFAFSFVNVPKCNLSELEKAPFFGSGVYAIYYHGTSEKAYLPLSCTETPIYVGKANPQSSNAESVEAQGQTLYSRLKEHAKTIGKTDLIISDFSFRSAAIQSGMQAAVEEFMIHLFRPIWNKEVKICFGIGKHGDNAITRKNRRSPWDTMHPGRRWAADTLLDQHNREDIQASIAAHFQKVPVIADKDTLFKLLSLG